MVTNGGLSNVGMPSSGNCMSNKPRRFETAFSLVDIIAVELQTPSWKHEYINDHEESDGLIRKP